LPETGRIRKVRYHEGRPVIPVKTQRRDENSISNQSQEKKKKRKSEGIFLREGSYDCDGRIQS